MTAARILLVETNEDGTAGGSYRCIADMAANIDRTVFTPVVLFYRANHFADELAARGIEVRIWEEIRAAEHAEMTQRSWVRARLRMSRATWRRRRFLTHERIALVHMNNTPYFNALEWTTATALAGVPMVAHSRGPIRRTNRFLARWMRARYRKVLAISESIRANVLDAGFPARKIERVYDGIDGDQVRRAAAEHAAAVRVEFRAGAQDGGVLGVMVGHLRAWKGQHVVLAALGRLPDDVRRRLRFVFVGGSGPDDAAYVEQLRRMAASDALRDIVTFAGERRDARAIMGVADFVVHASTEPEPFGLVVVEAMALGKPVIASSLGGPAETVAPGSGLLFDPSDPSMLSSLIARLVLSPDERRTLGEGARSRAEAFSITRNIRHVEAVYRAVLGLPPA